MDVKTTFRNLVRDQSVSICMLQFVPGNAGLKIVILSPFSKPNIYAPVERCSGAIITIEKIEKVIKWFTLKGRTSSEIKMIT